MSVEDQASKLRQMVSQSHRTRTIAVCSGKGGVGKSNIALNLAILMSAGGRRVALVDADLALANLDVLMDLDVRNNLSHVIAGSKSIEDVIVDLPTGVQFVPGASGLTKLASLSQFDRARLLETLTALEDDNEIIVIDTGAGIGPDVLQFASSADNALVVTAPEPTAITDAYALVKALLRHDYRGQVGLLVNFVSGRQEARSTYQRISSVAKQFLGATVLDAGYVVIDPKLREAVRRREPFVLAQPRCPASRCLAAVATKLAGTGTMMEGKEGFFRRVVNWLA